MQQTLKVEHKNEMKKDRRSGKGRVIALSRTVFHITGKNVYYVESESQDNVFYYIMWNPGENVEYCSCVDEFFFSLFLFIILLKTGQS